VTVSDEDKALIKNLYQLKDADDTDEDTDEMFGGKLVILLKKKKEEAQTEGTRVADRSTRVLKRT